MHHTNRSAPSPLHVTLAALVLAGACLGIAVAADPPDASSAADVAAAETALRDAARAGDLATVKRLVEEGGVNVDAPTRYGATALSYACDRGHADVVRYLVENGADPAPEDSFYGATPITWAAMGEHIDVLEVLLEAGSGGADTVLSVGVRGGNAAMVRLALAREDLPADAVRQARQAAANLEDGEEIVALLAAVELPPQEAAPAVEVPAETLSTYAGTYRSEDVGLDLTVRVADGVLLAQATGQPELTLTATSPTEFDVVGVPNLSLAFRGRGGMIERVDVLQGGQTIAFPRVDPTAEAAPGDAGAEAAARAEAEAAAEVEAIAEAMRPAPRTEPRNWPQFRGPRASGVADGQGAPVTWNVETGENVLWKTPVPGLANSSPVVWDGTVFVTTAISSAGDDTFRTGLYGDVDSVEDTSVHTFRIYALDLRSGAIRWEHTVAKRAPGAKRHLKSTQANSTPVTDGARVCALFGTIGTLGCWSMDGKSLWTRDVGVLDAGWFYDESYQWGHASSPILHDGKVIVQADLYRDSWIAAWNVEDGSPAWRTPRDEIPSWGTPTVVPVGDGHELVTNAKTIRGYDPSTGKERWSLARNSEVTVATPIFAHGFVYVTAGYPPIRPVYAIRPGAEGAIEIPEDGDAPEAIAWHQDRGGTYMPTPIVVDELLYTCANDGRLTAYDARTGERVYRQRIGAGTFTASPVAADGRLYFTSEEGEIVVATAGRTYRELARNDMGEVCMATPAISNGVMVVRTLGHVVGLGAPPPEEGVAAPVR